MKFRYAFLFYLLAFLLPVPVFACSCNPVKGFQTAEDLKNYDFIALAEVTGLAAVKDSVPPFPTREDGSVHIRIMELFKWKPIEMLDEPSVNTSCDLGLRVGQQWLFFGWKDASGKTMIGRCSYTVRYRSTSGLRDWQSFTGMQQLVLLRTIFNKPVPAGPERTIRYASGRTEVEQKFRNGKVHGLRKIYYPTGELYVAEKFSRGKRKGYRKIFGTSGQLFRHTTYRKGNIRTWISYFDPLHMEGLLRFEATRLLRKDTPVADESSMKRVVDSLRIRIRLDPVYEKREFEPDGRSYHYRTFFPGGRLHEETVLNWPDKSYTRKVYNETGVLRYRTTLDGKSGSEIYEELEGSTRKRIGKCTSCDIYFNPSLSDAIPEPMIIP